MTSLPTSDSVEDILRGLLSEVARLRADPGQLRAEDDLYAAGLSSLATVDLMLAIEDRFGIEFPEDRLNRRTFGSIAALSDAVLEAQGTAG